MDKFGFLRRLFVRKNNNEEIGFAEEILGDKQKRKKFADFWRQNESDFIYLLEVLFYLEQQKNFGSDLREYRRGMVEIVNFFGICVQEEQLDKVSDEEGGSDPDFVAGF